METVILYTSPFTDRKPEIQSPATGYVENRKAGLDDTVIPKPVVHKTATPPCTNSVAPSCSCLA